MEGANVLYAEIYKGGMYLTCVERAYLFVRRMHQRGR